MCELFAMSSRLPTGAGYSIRQLSRHGGAEGPHRDGWGVAYYAGRDVQLLREAIAASDSKLVEHFECCAPPSSMVLSHLRLASFGERTLSNTQPFVREIGGRMHVFAHNGDLAALLKPGSLNGSRFRPIGETDSERACCLLLENMADLWSDADADADVVPLSDRLAAVRDFARRIREFGPANFVYADGETVFAHAHERTVPGDEAVLPGLYLLTRSCRETPHLLPGDDQGQGQKAAQAIALVASVPLTDETWRPLENGELVALSNGVVVESTTV